MTSHVAVSVLGKDQPGIVASITKALYNAGCNIEDSSMTLLCGEFAMILLVALPPKTGISQLKQAFVPAEKKLGLSVLIRNISNLEDAAQKSKGNAFILSVYGADKPGIVYGISNMLAKNKINITDVQTNISKSSKNPVYIMLLEVDVPKTITQTSLKSRLEKIARSLKVTVTIRPAGVARL